MSTGTTPDPLQDGTHDRVAAAITVLQGDLNRSDGKASMLLALTGAALAAVVSVGANFDLTVPAAVVGAAGAVALLAATVILLLAVRPNLGGTGWTEWPGLSHEQLRAQLVSGYQVDQARFMAGLAVRKFRRIRVAVDCILAGLALLTLTTVLAVV